VRKRTACVQMFRHDAFVPAGSFSEAVEFPPEDVDEWVECSTPVSAEAFALRVRGPSMEPEFRAGEIIVVDPNRQYESGDFVIAKNGDDEATFKRYHRDGDRHFLTPVNSDWGKPMDMTGKDWRVVGRVIEKMKKY